MKKALRVLCAAGLAVPLWAQTSHDDNIQLGGGGSTLVYVRERTFLPLDQGPVHKELAQHSHHTGDRTLRVWLGVQEKASVRVKDGQQVRVFLLGRKGNQWQWLNQPPGPGQADIVIKRDVIPQFGSGIHTHGVRGAAVNPCPRPCSGDCGTRSGLRACRAVAGAPVADIDAMLARLDQVWRISAVDGLQKDGPLVAELKDPGDTSGLIQTFKYVPKSGFDDTTIGAIYVSDVKVWQETNLKNPRGRCLLAELDSHPELDQAKFAQWDNQQGNSYTKSMAPGWGPNSRFSHMRMMVDQGRYKVPPGCPAKKGCFLTRKNLP